MTGIAPPRRLALQLLAARAVLWTEILVQRFWPALAATAVVLAVALSGVLPVLPWAVHLTILLAGLAAVTVLLAHAALGLRAPERGAGERRLELDSSLKHRPFATLRDRPADLPDAGQAALWRLHQARARSALAALRLAPPRPDLPRHDPYALRAAAILLLGAGLVAAGPNAATRLRSSLSPGLPDIGAGTQVQIQAWIQPPAYTGLPPVFLPAAGGAGAVVTVPTGSRLSVSVTGLSGTPSLSLAGHALRVENLGRDSFQSGATLSKGGQLTVGAGFSTLAGWTLAVLPNEPPAASWPAPPGRAGTSLSTRLPWRVQQRWGVARLEAVLQPQNRPDLPRRHIKLPLPGTPRDATGAATPDLSSDPYAGLTLTGRLSAEDVSGQHGQSAPAEFVLPAREFRHPLARAIAELRRRLALHPADRAQAADDLAALAEAPFAPAPGLPASGVVLNLTASAALLQSRRSGAAETDQAQARLWTLALALDGALPDAAARALAQAREDLKRGIEDHARGKLSDRELNQKLDTLRQALDKQLADLANRAAKQGALQKFDPGKQHLSAPAIDRLIRKLEQALRDGKTEDARQTMAELERMMDQLKSAHIMTPEEQRQQQEQARQGRQQMGAVQDLVQRESGLLDHAQSRAAPVPEPPPGLPPGLAQQLEQLTQPQDPAEDPTQAPLAPPPAPGAQAQRSPPPSPGHPRPQDARTQRALHRALDALKDGLAQAGRPKPPSLDDASRAMQDAAGALAEARDPQARDAIARAIAALQQGGQEMSRQQSQQSGAGMQLSLQQGGQGQKEQGEAGQEGEDESGDGNGGQRRDPFGRPVDGSGTLANDPDLRVPDKMEEGRSRAIQEELRRRGADRGRPKGELDYIGRLLKPF